MRWWMTEYVKARAQERVENVGRSGCAQDLETSQGSETPGAAPAGLLPAGRPPAGLPQSGLTLVELLVSLVITSLLATAIFAFFLNTGQSVSQQSANGEMWQRGRNAMSIMRQAIESAGYGLPSYSQCPAGVVGISNTSATTGGALVAITASVQSSGSSYDPSSASLGGVSTYAFSTVIGGGSFGGAPATTVLSQNGKSSTLQVSNIVPLNPGDMALIVPTGGSAVCVLGQITNVPGKGGCSNSGNGSAGGANVVTFHSGSGDCYFTNPTQIFNLPSGVNGSTFSPINASLYDLGSQNFLFEQFQIMENPAGSTPTLYMTQYTGLQASAPTPQPLASGVVDIQMQYGLGSNGSVQSWISPTAYNQSVANNSSIGSIVAVQLSMLIRSTQYLPNSVSPARFNLLGQTYTVPTSGGPGCLQGNCRHYEYHLFQSVIPVRNGIWGGE